MRKVRKEMIKSVSMCKGVEKNYKKNMSGWQKERVGGQKQKRIEEEEGKRKRKRKKKVEVVEEIIIGLEDREQKIKE